MARTATRPRPPGRGIHLNKKPWLIVTTTTPKCQSKYGDQERNKREYHLLFTVCLLVHFGGHILVILFNHCRT